MIDIDFKGELHLPIPRSHNAFVVITDGEGDLTVNGISDCNAVAFGHDGDEVVLQGRGHGVLFMASRSTSPTWVRAPSSWAAAPTCRTRSLATTAASWGASRP